jgi:uncharacterized protein
VTTALVTDDHAARLRGRLRAVLNDIGPVVIAVSGGVDSLTLMAFAHELGVADGLHAVSPAVPALSTQRVRDLAEARGWRVRYVDAGETSDERYLANPVDRCHVCKSHLYDAIGVVTRAVAGDNGAARAIASGTNVDDLGDYRPGLDAARERGVRHPFVDAGFTKADVRVLARALGLGDVAELPAQPCLSSRVETGVRIDAKLLALVNDVEDAVRARLGPHTTVRCRVRHGGRFIVELDAHVLASLADRDRDDVISAASARGAADVALATYKMGSAFLRVL